MQSKLLHLYEAYVSNFCSIDDNRGLIEPTAPIRWEPHLLADIKPFTFQQYKDAITSCTLILTYKLLITYLYLKRGHSVVWNHRPNRSNTIDIWIPSIFTGYHIPNGPYQNSSYESIRRHRKRLVHATNSHILRARIYISHPTWCGPVYNSYWKSQKWFYNMLPFNDL